VHVARGVCALFCLFIRLDVIIYATQTYIKLNALRLKTVLFMHYIKEFHFIYKFLAACCSCKFVAAYAKLSSSSPSQVAHSKNIFIIFITIVILAQKFCIQKVLYLGNFSVWKGTRGTWQKSFYADNELTTDF